MDNSIASRLRRKKRLGDLLLGAGVITQEQLEEALKKQKEAGNGQKLGMTLVDMGIMNDEIIAEALCHQMGLERVHLAGITIEDEVLALVDEKVLRKYMLLPYEFAPDNPNVLRVAFSDPLDMIAMDDLSIITGMQIEVRVTTVKDVSQALDRFYGNSEAMKVADQFAAERREKYGNNKDGKEESEEVKQAPIVRLVNQIIEQAVHKRTSDIHFEPLENQLRIRFRVDGVLQEAMRHDISLLSAMVARIKIVGGMDISEKRKPQDGRMTQIVDRQEYDIRVSILPTVYGEKIVMRLAQKTALSRDKKDLGFEPEELHRFEDILKHPNGIMLVTGPTGSGKSTTLASIINKANENLTDHIITLEDPIEYIHHHNKAIVNQREVGMDTLSYANALRAALREDPDIILVGEMRDLETISTAITAAETGHLVFSTLHTIGAASTIDRIIDIFPTNQQQQVRVQLAMVLEGVISQSLLPTANGQGRVAAFEVMLASPAIRSLIREAKTHQIQSTIQTSRQLGMITMDDALYDLFSSGTITREMAMTYAQDQQYLRKKINGQ